MIKFILILIGLYIIMSYPILILVVAGSVIGWYLYKKKPDLFPSLPSYLSASPPKTEKIPAEEMDFETTKEQLARIDKELEKKMKPGFRDDPEWQKSTEELRKTVAKNRAAADKEMALEMLEEATEYAKAGKWSEVTRLERELQDLAAKS